MRGTNGLFRRAAAPIAVLALSAALSGAHAAAAARPAHHPLYMPAAGQSGNPALQPPAVALPPVCLSSPAAACLPYQAPPAGQPWPVNMAYFGGHVQVRPRIYLVFWGWGRPGAFNHHSKHLPANDPDGAAARMTAFVKAMGGTAWTGSQTQYFETVGGKTVHITNPKDQLGGVWHDDAHRIHNDLSGWDLAREAERAVAHFHVRDLENSQFVIAQPQMFNEKGFDEAQGYCAWHDYTQTKLYPGVREGISFTNMPYVLNMGPSCGENAVHDGGAGRLDGFTIVLGHEIEETVTDPGAEVVDGSGLNGVALGGWYDFSGYENADKCAWVGNTPVGREARIPGATNDIVGNDGRKYPVQSLWSNQAAGGAGYCAGAGDDFPA